MPLAPQGMGLPGMAMMPPAFMPGLHMVSAPMQPAAGNASEPAAGIPVGGLMQPGQAGKQQQRPVSGNRPAQQKRHSQQGQGQQVKQAAAGTPAAAGAAAKSCAAAGGSSNKPAAGSTSPASPSTAAADAASPTAHSPAAQQQQQQAQLHAQLEALDLAALKPWVLSHFCEDVYLLLLDVWRPGSAKVADAIWAWKLHVRQPQQSGSAPDYRAFLVSLFGLEKLLQLTAAERACAGAGCPAAAAAALPAPAPVLARQGTAGGIGNSSAADGATAMVTAGSTAGVLATAGSAIGGLVVPAGVLVAGATSPAVAGKAVQPQPAYNRS
jgi:hypothetical protein